MAAIIQKKATSLLPSVYVSSLESDLTHNPELFSSYPLYSSHYKQVSLFLQSKQPLILHNLHVPSSA